MKDFVLNIDRLEKEFGTQYPNDFYYTVLDIAADPREQMDEQFWMDVERSFDMTGNEKDALNFLISDYYGKYKDIKQRIQDIKNGEIIYRALDFDDVGACNHKDVDLNDVGTSWTYQRRSAASFGECIIEGQYPDKIDEDFTVKINTVEDKEGAGEIGENEIRLMPNSQIKLIRICPFNDQTDCDEFLPNTYGKVMN